MTIQIPNKEHLYHNTFVDYDTEGTHIYVYPHGKEEDKTKISVISSENKVPLLLESTQNCWKILNAKLKDGLITIDFCFTYGTDKFKVEKGNINGKTRFVITVDGEKICDETGEVQKVRVTTSCSTRKRVVEKLTESVSNDPHYSIYNYCVESTEKLTKQDAPNEMVVYLGEKKTQNTNLLQHYFQDKDKQWLKNCDTLCVRWTSIEKNKIHAIGGWNLANSEPKCQSFLIDFEFDVDSHRENIISKMKSLLQGVPFI